MLKKSKAKAKASSMRPVGTASSTPVPLADAIEATVPISESVISDNATGPLVESLIEVIEETLEDKISNAKSIVIPTYERYKVLYKERVDSLYDEFKQKKDEMEELLLDFEEIVETLDKMKGGKRQTAQPRRRRSHKKRPTSSKKIKSEPI